jgi:hypothetical protein
VCERLDNGAAAPPHRSARRTPARTARRWIGYNARVRRKLLRGKRNPFAIDAPLPPGGVARWATIAGLVVGGIVALLVPVFFAIMLIGMLRGE